MITTITAHGAADSDGWVLMLGSGADVRAVALPGRGELVIGRDPGCDVAVDDRGVSRRHARLVIGDGWSLEDLGSHNGCEIAGRRLTAGRAMLVGAGEPFSIGPFSAVIVPRPVSNMRAAAGGSRVVVEDATLTSPVPSILTVARSAVNIVIEGETGSGKEILARAIHARSGRTGPMIGINCAALSPALLESELFGHEKGAFTGASHAKVGLFAGAAGGTLLLDEIGELPLGVQAAMLRVVETREVRRVGAVVSEPIDVRILAATNRDLAELCTLGTFRRDLYYRLAGITLVVPPLRERRRQIVPLARAFAAQASKSAAVLGPSAAARLGAHDWPGNVRELKNVVERAVLLAGSGPIDPDHIRFDEPSDATRTTGARSPAPPPPPPSDLSPDDLASRERIIAALDACAGNQTAAARRLGIARSNLAHKLVLYGIPRPRKG